MAPLQTQSWRYIAPKVNDENINAGSSAFFFLVTEATDVQQRICTFSSVKRSGSKCAHQMSYDMTREPQHGSGERAEEYEMNRKRRRSGARDSLTENRIQQ